ncbi:dihydrofolate reductase [Desulfobulbus alkaliphilus]|uniref:dihydrofolate reductase n=1 Tax=Desulfobulbus alkaliphilus TaxID=869814 RepID=UPI001962AA95|nr:dihydrofolate reductase [Desulfobulbus alkaliphilus]MBM9538334.1 dihydrofolate reductase [Desulfobulbus alkaliphilus]
MELIIIAALAAHRVIAFQQAIPWHLPQDMAHFKAVTMGHTLIMGRRTYTSIGHPLPGRRNIIVSSTLLVRPHPDSLVVPSLSAALAHCQQEARVFCIGGGQLYRAFLPIAHSLILTMIDLHVQGDVFFPDFSDLPFSLVASIPLTTDPPSRIEIYQRTSLDP